MSRFDKSLSARYFEDLYAVKADPWEFASSAYEAAKYDATMAALPQGRFADALEVGCSIGVLTRQLATRCDHLLAIDIADLALDQARQRNKGELHVRFERRRIPDEWPDGCFDLIMLSEVVYYLDREDVGRLAAKLRPALKPKATVVLVHWLGQTHYPLTGDEAADLVTAGLAGAASPVVQVREPLYRLDVLRAPS